MYKIVKSWCEKYPVISSVLLLTLIVLPWLWGRGLQNPDETRYGSIALEMINRGNYIIPHLKGVPYFEKPPLLYWLGSLSTWFFGENEGSLRIWAFISGVSIVGLSSYISTKLYSIVAGLNAGLICATSLLIMVSSQLFNADLLVAALITASLISFIQSVSTSENPKGQNFLFLYIFCALAVLAKGLIGVVLPGIIILIWCCLARRFDILRACIWIPGILLFLGITVPWHYAVEIQYPGFLKFYFINEHFQRFTTETHNRNKPIWFFLVVLTLGMLPWTGFIYSAIYKRLRKWRWRETSSQTDLFFIVWAVVIFLFFTLSNSQLAGYILPMVAPLGILLGKNLAKSESQGDRLYGLEFSFIVMLSVALYIGLVGIYIPITKEHILYLGICRWILAAGALITAAGFLWQLMINKVSVTNTVIAFLPFLISVNYSAAIIQPKSIKDLITGNLNTIQNNPVAVYKTYLLDPTYYLNKPSLMINVVGELGYGLNASPRPDIFQSESELIKRLNSGELIFILLRKHKLSELPHLTVIDQQGDIVLAKNSKVKP
jgi:4-amino-4-deoxy-L-arabinose transferase-like glycosyltransferase